MQNLHGSHVFVAKTPIISFFPFLKKSRGAISEKLASVWPSKLFPELSVGD